jgi:hypothetical protein
MATKPEFRETEERPFTFAPGDDWEDLEDPPFIFNPGEEIDEGERRSWQLEGEAYEKIVDKLLDEN